VSGERKRKETATQQHVNGGLASGSGVLGAIEICAWLESVESGVLRGTGSGVLEGTGSGEMIDVRASESDERLGEEASGISADALTNGWRAGFRAWERSGMARSVDSILLWLAVFRLWWRRASEFQQWQREHNTNPTLIRN
jgi:hypothetical protein